MNNSDLSYVSVTTDKLMSTCESSSLSKNKISYLLDSKIIQAVICKINKKLLNQLVSYCSKGPQNTQEIILGMMNYFINVYECKNTSIFILNSFFYITNMFL